MRDRRKARNRNIVDARKELCKCDYCGISFNELWKVGVIHNPEELHFHHKTGPHNFPISKATNKTETQLLKELEKCELICEDIHQEFHPHEMKSMKEIAGPGFICQFRKKFEELKNKKEKPD